MFVPRLVLAPLLALSACTAGVIPRDLPPPEPAAEAPASEPASEAPATDAPASESAAPVTYKLDGNRLELPGPIVFQAGGDTLDPASDPALNHARGFMADKPAISMLRVEGHADDQALSERRAVAVARWLIAHDVACTRLIAVGFGPTKPIADTSTPEGKAQNTRVELHAAQMMGRPIGGAPPDGGGQVAAASLCD